MSLPNYPKSVLVNMGDGYKIHIMYVSYRTIDCCIFIGTNTTIYEKQVTNYDFSFTIMFELAEQIWNEFVELYLKKEAHNG